LSLFKFVSIYVSGLVNRPKLISMTVTHIIVRIFFYRCGLTLYHSDVLRLIHEVLLHVRNIFSRLLSLATS